MLLQCVEFLFELWISSMKFECSVELFYSYPVALKYPIPDYCGCHHYSLVILPDACLVFNDFIFFQKGATISLVRNFLLFVYKD